MKLFQHRALSVNTILTFTFSLMLTALVLLCGTAVNLFAQNAFIQSSVNSSQQLMAQSRFTANRFFFRVNSSLYTLAQSPALISYCQAADTDDAPRLLAQAAPQIETLTRTQEDISNLFVFAKDSCIYQSTFSIHPFLDAPLIQDLFAAQKIPQNRLITYHPASYPTYYNTSYPDHGLEIPISVLIQNSPTSATNCGTLLATLPLTVLDELFSQTGPEDGLTTFILTEDRTIFYSDDHEWIGKPYDAYLSSCGVAATEASFLLDPTGRKILLEDSKRLNFNDWSLVLTTDLNDLNESIDRIRFLIVVSALVVFALTLFLNHLLTRRITAPLAALSQQMEHLNHSSLSNKMDTRSLCLEVRQLYSGYNHMLERIEALLDKVYYEQLRQKEAQYEALQAKINPHFLYNTLQSISSLAILNRTEDIETVTSALGGMLEYLTYEKNSEVFLSKDLEYIRRYIQIQQLRYNNRFIVGYEIDPRTLTCRINKLLLQPMVENAIKHGLESKPSGGRLFIRTSLIADLLIIEVQDNGAGMDEATLQRLIQNTNTTDKNSSSKSIGLSNIQERIHLKYGTEYGITIRSALNQGTTVTVKIPAYFSDSEET